MSRSWLIVILEEMGCLYQILTIKPSLFAV
jgi:hypothetical protein